MPRFFNRLTRLLLGSALLGSGFYLGSGAFSSQWHDYVVGQLAGRGVHLDFEHMMLNPFGGVTVREVRLYADDSRRQMLAQIDRLTLDFDYGRLLEKKIVVEALELSHANVRMPVDPDDPDSGQLELLDFSARAFLREDHLDIRRAEGLLSGIRLRITGDLTLPERKPEAAHAEDAAMPGLVRVDLLRDHRKRVQRGLEWLERFTFTGEPSIDLQVSGPLARPLELRARLSFEARGLAFGGYECRQLRADAEFNAGMIDVSRFQLRDHVGEVLASAGWRMGSEDLRFHLTSSADLPGLAAAFLNSDNLREIVFYEPPHLALEGVWHVDGPYARMHRPVKVTGSLQCGRFSTRGEMFESLNANLGVAPEGVYIRDLLLRHKTGTLTLQALMHHEKGFKYRTVVKLDPKVFLPFANQAQTREIISRFQFTPESGIHLELEGEGPEPDLPECVNKGRGELRNFRYRGVELDLMAADVEFHDKTQLYRNVRLRRPEGEGEAAEVHADDQDHWVRLTGVKTSMDPVQVIRCFAPKTAEAVARYRLPDTTRVTLDGTIGTKGSGHHDFKVKFEHPEGPAYYRLWDEDHLISAPKGSLVFKRDIMDYDISGRLFGEPMTASGKVNLNESSGDYTVTLRAGSFPYSIFERKMPFEDVTAEIKSTAGNTSFDIGSRVLGGKFSLKGTLNESQANRPYAGELRVDAVSFQKLARLYTQDVETTGDFTGHFKFTGQMKDWQELKGGGAVILLNGNLSAVPILGPLTPLLSTLIPTQIKGFNVVKEASATFEVADGFVVTRDMEALTSAFRIGTQGRIDFIRDAIDLTAQVRIRGLAGIVLLPFSELLEYRGTGSVARTKWTPNLLAGGRAKSDGRKPPTAEQMRAAEKIAGEPPRPDKVQEPPRKPQPLFSRPKGN